MPTFHSNGAQLYYVEEGTGSPFVLLHGLHGSSVSVKHEISRLKAHFRVIALDARGHGKSDRPSNYTLEEHVQDVIHLLDHLGIETTDLMGISMGSYIAQGVAIAVHDRIKRLILVVPKSHGATSSMQELLGRHEAELEGLSAEQKYNHVSKYIYHNFTEMQKVFGDASIQQSKLTSPQEQEASNKALEGFDFRNQLNQITACTLVISGTYDGLNPPERGKETASLIPDSSYVEFMHSGHAPSIEEEEHFFQEVLNFLEPLSTLGTLV
ncbi:alpha/beta fold hydrolase [Paenibacillus sp. MAH-36]|uniref:Alpha/beta fold hydrolase n=1 Tax=Paenibacillus violae TaxID=3077234 RepID=A0ABU3RKS3_9BACL|nr:alpha/beta fold hydrolase [Paenibacillus sp. PFR10]MDU0204883.1 alpha/beta fold hydrolase [Paenibacillus sp. PFR10]